MDGNGKRSQQQPTKKWTAFLYAISNSSATKFAFWPCHKRLCFSRFCVTEHEIHAVDSFGFSVVGATRSHLLPLPSYWNTLRFVFFSSSFTLFDVAFFESVCYIDLESLHFHDRAHYIHTNSCWLLVWKFASRMHYSFMKTYYSIDKKPETQIARIPWANHAKKLKKVNRRVSKIALYELVKRCHEELRLIYF